MANGTNGKVTISKETLLPLGLIFVFLGSAFWFGVEKTALEARVRSVEEKLEQGLKREEAARREVERLESEITRLRLAQVEWKVKLKEASDEAHRAISRADQARVNAGVNATRLDRLEK